MKVFYLKIIERTATLDGPEYCDIPSKFFPYASTLFPNVDSSTGPCSTAHIFIFPLAFFRTKIKRLSLEKQTKKESHFLPPSIRRTSNLLKTLTNHGIDNVKLFYKPTEFKTKSHNIALEYFDLVHYTFAIRIFVFNAINFCRYQSFQWFKRTAFK